jgi:hypothetical protein
MGKTFSTGLLTDGISQDSSNNIGIGVAPSGTNKFEVSGSTKLNGNTAITGSLSVTAGITGSLQGTASFATTASYLTGYISPFPYTGSAVISGSLTVTGSLNTLGSVTSTGTLTAQTLVVQTITSSVLYSSGSNIFGNSLGNTQAMTGSVGITGSLTLNNIAIPTSASLASTYLQLAGGTLTGALGGTSATFSGAVIIGAATNTNELNIYATTSPTIKFQNSGADRGKISSNSSALVYNSLTGNGHDFQIDGVSKFTLAATTGAATFSSNSNTTISNTFQNTNTTDTNTRNYFNIIAGTNRISLYSLHSDNNYINTAYGDLYFQMNASTSATSPMIIKASGNVGIGTTTPTSLLNISTSDATAYDATVDDGQAANGATLTLRNGSTTASSFAQINMQVSADSGRAEARIVGICMASATSDMAFVTENANVKAEKMRITSAGTVQPGANGTQDLGTSSLRWATVYTSDLSLSNGIGDYTIVEGEDDLFLYNNKSNKVYKFMLAEVDPANATPKKST